MDVFDEFDINLSSLFQGIVIEPVECERLGNEEIKVESTVNDDEENDVYLDDKFSSYDFVNNNGEVETFWTCDPETCTISFDVTKAEKIKSDLIQKRKYRTQRKMDDREIVPSRDEVRKQEFFPKYDDVDSVQESSFLSTEK